MMALANKIERYNKIKEHIEESEILKPINLKNIQDLSKLIDYLYKIHLKLPRVVFPKI